MRRRYGFTLVELLVVIAIIAVLIGLLVPAVQKIREASARTKCISHLKQVGLALHAYHDVHKVFPSGYLSSFDNAGNDTGPGWGWAAMVLPYLEQKNLHAAIKFDQPIEAAVHASVRVTSLPVYLCPSDSATPTWTAVSRDALGVPTGTICEVASANYVAVFGISEPGVDGEGIFSRNSKIKIADITDGTSQTMMVGERSQRWCEATWVGAPTNGSLFPGPTSPAIVFVQNASGMTLGHTFEGPPNTANLECNNFNSRHSGGANFAFADGHVSFLLSSMDGMVFRYLSTRAGNEKISEEY